MFVYIDESGDHKNYVLGAVASDSRELFARIVKKFRAEVRNSGLSEMDKKKINNDPKEHSLYRDHPRLLVKYIDLIAFDHEQKSKPPRTNLHLCGAYYTREGIETTSFPEERMLTVYEALFMQVIGALNTFSNGDNLEIVFDHFNKAEEVKARLISTISQTYPQLTYTLDYAQGGEKGQHLGLYVADIVAGTCRRFVGKDTPNYFHYMKGLFIKDLINTKA